MFKVQYMFWEDITIKMAYTILKLMYFLKNFKKIQYNSINPHLPFLSFYSIMCENSFFTDLPNFHLIPYIFFPQVDKESICKCYMCSVFNCTSLQVTSSQEF